MINKKFILFVFSMVLISCIDESQRKNINESTKDSNLKEEFYENGNIKIRTKLENNIEHGLYYKFHKNGMIEKSGVKIKGKKNGLWKYNDTLGRVISARHYYNDSLVYNLEVDDFEYVKKKLGSSADIKIPKKWTIVYDAIENPILLVLKKECQKDISFCPNFTITHESPVVNSEIDNYLNKSNEVLKSSFSNFRIIKERKYVSEETTYFEKIYTGSSQGIGIGGITTWVFDNNKTYIMTGLALNENGNSFLKYEGLFKDVINHMKLY